MNYQTFVHQMTQVRSPKPGLSRLLYAFVGMASEGGEALDILKKVAFHDKPFDIDTKMAIIKELGDIRYYYQLALNEMNIDDEEVVEINKEKLIERHGNPEDGQVNPFEHYQGQS